MEHIDNHTVDGGTRALRQVNVGQIKAYDPEYVRSRYDTIDCTPMSQLRFELLFTHAPVRKGFRLLDFGCGNGSFLQFAQASKLHQPKVAGFDISHYPVAGVPMVADPTADEYDVVTFFDSLEHVPDVEGLLAQLKTNCVMISVPWCHAAVMGAAWFNGWKHRRTDEHLWYFDATSLCQLMHRAGYRTVFLGNPEDEIRKPVDHLPNILTGIFVRDWTRN